MSVALPIPEPRADDDEDVHWALSTASALWARGESQEALKWLRRAAETASDVNRDMRALELFKAAADFTGRIQAAASAASTAPPLPPLGSPPPPMPGSSAPPTPQMTPQAAAAGGPPPMPGAARAGHAPAAAGEMPRSAPPPPPRGRAGSAANIPAMPTTSFPSVGRPRLPSSPGEIGEERIEPMAPTVLHPSQSAGPGAAAGQGARTTTATGASAEKPFAARAAATLVAGRGLDTKAAKTLASNMSYGNLQRSEQEQFRNAVSKAATISAAQAREIASAAARQMPGVSDRATHAGVGPTSLAEPAPATQLMPPPAPDTTPALAAAAQAARASGGAGAAGPVSARGAGRAAHEQRPPPGATAGREATTSGNREAGSGPVSDRSRAQAKRRATLRRQGPGAIKPEPVIRDSARIPEARPTQRFEEEITIERDLSHIQGQSGGSDLDENTNVLTGQEVDVEVGEQRANGAPAEPSGDADGDSAPEPVTSIHHAALPALTGAQGLSAFRIALVSDVVTGVIEATLLAAGEPVPAGRIPAVVVATDAASSSALAELFSRSSSTRKGTRS